MAAFPPEPSADLRPAPLRARIGLSGKLLLLTIVFVMLAEVLIYVPSIANFRSNWLNDRLAAAQVAAMVLDAAPSGAVPRDLEKKLLEAVGATTIVVRSRGARRLLAASDMPPEAALSTDLRDASALTLVADAFDTLLSGGDRVIRVTGAGMDRIDFVEITLPERPLRRSMLAFSRNILILSLIISGITALLVYLALHLLIVRPVRRLSENVVAFAGDPENSARVVEPSRRSDEIGIAENAVASMERALAASLREKKHLAEVGLAVSKINHDLRNMLSSAQLISDRLVAVPDPATQRFAPKLIAALDRAIGFSQSILDYGKAQEREPQRKPVALAQLFEEVEDGLGLSGGGSIRLVRDVSADLVVQADPEQLYRALLNLGRNAVEALRAQAAEGKEAVVAFSATRRSGALDIEIADNGPGIPARARETLFRPFQGSATPGGTGLGLAIAAELVGLHGGDISAVDSGSGARFRITLPDR